MSTYNVHAGHGIAGCIGCGAVGILDESVEDRKVKNKLIELLRQQGHTVYDCTFESSASPNTILNQIVKKCNTNAVDLDISIHLNSGRNDGTGDGKTGGVEVFGYNEEVKKIGSRICEKISGTLGITNRGFKINQNLYVLNSTKSKAILIECCFVDDRDDANRWNPEKCAQAIAEALTGKAASQAAVTKKQAKVQLYSVNGTEAQRFKVHHNQDGTVSLENVACGLYLDVAGASTKDGAVVQVYEKNGTASQKWKMEQMKGGYTPSGTAPFIITSALSGKKCLDVAGAGKTDGTKIDIYTKNRSAAQQWSIIDHGDGTWTMINAGSCKALDVVGGGK